MDEDIPFEYNVIALAFKQEGAIELFSEMLPPEFVGAIHGQSGISQFYQALIDFYEKTGLDPVDMIAFRSWLETETDIYSALGGAFGISVFLDTVDKVELSTPTAVVKVLRHRANKRKQLDSLQELQLLVSKKEHKTPEDHTRINYLTEQIRTLENEIGYNPLEKVVTGHNIATKADQLWTLPDFLPTPFRKLNMALGYSEDAGFVKGAVSAILAPSGQGKSTFAKCLMNHWVDAGHTVLYVNFEEAVSHWERILFTQVTKQNIYKGANLSDQERTFYTQRFQEKMNEWGDRFIVRHDPDTPYFEDLEKWFRDILGHNDKVPDAIIIDTIQSMFTKGSGGKPRWGQYEEMMVRLEKLAKDMHSAMIITAQENTNRMKERREVVLQSDTGGSISIVQKCTVSVHLTQKNSNEDWEDEYVMELQIPKNRITGTAFTGDPPAVKYNDTTKSYEEWDPVTDKSYNAGSVLDRFKDGDYD
ncbi:MAG TPA: DnaB-like helicase C-terminal domain-containing protein [Nitrososphaera sp.]|nr:DnaB-like helicase C-terminal domain-containing protein [Nitrososphaera sp.]